MEKLRAFLVLALVMTGLSVSGLAFADTASPNSVNVQGESSDFDDYLNSDLFTEDDEIRLMDVDDNSRVVLGADGAPAGVSFKKRYENSPVLE